MPEAIRSELHPHAFEIAHEVTRRVAVRGGTTPQSLPYVVPVSNPITAFEKLQIAAAGLARTPIAVMPHHCGSVEEWCQQFASPGIAPTVG
jgi:hypothetical protein